MSNSTSRGGGWRFLSLYLQRNLPFLLLFLTSRCLHAHLRAQVREGAALALRAARRADAPAVLDERVADPGPAVPRDDPVEVALGLHRVRLARPAEAPREAPDVRIHDDAVRRTPDVSEDDVRRLAPDTRQCVKGLHRARDLAAMLRHEGLRDAAQGFRFRVEEARRPDDLLERSGRRDGQGTHVREAPEQLRCDLVDARVGALLSLIHI